MNSKCPNCKSEKTEPVIIRLSNKQEQKVILCNVCKRIFRKKGEK